MNRYIGVGTFQTTPRMKQLINETLDAGRLTYGPLSKELEQRFAKMHQCNFGVLSNSGTSSLQVALQAMKELHGWRDGDEVIVPSVTFVATVNIILHNRLKPVLADVDPYTYNIDPDEVLGNFSRYTRAIIPVHLFGQPASVQAIKDGLEENFYDDRHTPIIEDSCECVLATHNKKSVGSLGDIGCFSTYVAHLLTTGVGGIATTNNRDYAMKMRSLVNHGRDGIYISTDDDDNLTADELHEVMSRRFRFESIGHSYRITELEAALGVAQLDDLPEIIETRKMNAARLNTGLKDLWDGGYIQLPTIAVGNTHSFMMYPVLSLRDNDKWPLCNYLEDRGIETREMLRLTDQPCYKGLWNPADFPVAEKINRTGFYIGCHQGMTDEDVDYVIEVFHDYFKTASRV